VKEVYDYRNYVDEWMERLLSSEEISSELLDIIELGLNHEEQHQELLLTDIKYILGHNPLLPAYDDLEEHEEQASDPKWLDISEGRAEIGYEGEDFHFDNEKGRHSVWLNGGQISSALVTNGEFIEFIEDGGYKRFGFWHAEGWDWRNRNDINHPLYWHQDDGVWRHYTLQGVKPVPLNAPVTHISYYEAIAFAEWKGMRLPTEFEWESIHKELDFGKRWEWTQSAYLPYPGFQKEPGAIGEYNGKFMVNQMVLRGGSIATPENHFRPTYRNFFHPQLRWQYTGFRLAKNTER
ncbi:MAG: ergothioneine biosynthesis protein EgtB, partial [Flavobacteriales bacterium]|nr:ergothioneine biosynthesis protein EgtB [Flavobacteriales bacterium]